MINKDELIAGAKRIEKATLETVIEFLNRYDAEAKFNRELKKPGNSEFSLNNCRVAATPKEFRELERKFKLRNMSIKDIDEFTEKVIDGINEMFVYYNKPPLTEIECQTVRNIIYKYFDMRMN